VTSITQKCEDIGQIKVANSLKVTLFSEAVELHAVALAFKNKAK